MAVVFDQFPIGIVFRPEFGPVFDQICILAADPELPIPVVKSRTVNVSKVIYKIVHVESLIAKVHRPLAEVLGERIDPRESLAVIAGPLRLAQFIPGIVVNHARATLSLDFGKPEENFAVVQRQNVLPGLELILVQDEFLDRAVFPLTFEFRVPIEIIQLAQAINNVPIPMPFVLNIPVSTIKKKKAHLQYSTPCPALSPSTKVPAYLTFPFS